MRSLGKWFEIVKHNKEALMTMREYLVIAKTFCAIMVIALPFIIAKHAIAVKNFGIESIIASVVVVPSLIIIAILIKSFLDMRMPEAKIRKKRVAVITIGLVIAPFALLWLLQTLLRTSS